MSGNQLLERLERQAQELLRRDLRFKRLEREWRAERSARLRAEQATSDDSRSEREHQLEAELARAREEAATSQAELARAWEQIGALQAQVERRHRFSRRK